MNWHFSQEQTNDERWDKKKPRKNDDKVEEAVWTS